MQASISMCFRESFQQDVPLLPAERVTSALTVQRGQAARGGTGRGCAVSGSQEIPQAGVFSSASLRLVCVRLQPTFS